MRLGSAFAILTNMNVDREKKGFGSEEKRFGSSETEIPGPGTHSWQTKNLEYHADSIGKKGYGAMASRSKSGRGTRVAYTGPGPGQYKPQTAADIEKYFNKSTVTSAFADKVCVLHMYLHTHVAA